MSRSWKSVATTIHPAPPRTCTSRQRPEKCYTTSLCSVQRTPRRRGIASGRDPSLLRPRVHREQPAVRQVGGAGELGGVGQAGLVEEGLGERGLHSAVYGKCSWGTEKRPCRGDDWLLLLLLVLLLLGFVLRSAGDTRDQSGWIVGGESWA